MKLLDSVNLTFITPCFCSGADPKKPEIRPASIRGEFRRWLRIFGADLKTESRIMGSAAGDTGTKSALVFRVRNVVVPESPFTEWENWQIATIDRPGKAYLTFFLTRQNPVKKCLAPGTRFTLEVLQRKELSPKDEKLFRKAWKAMVDYGSLGARVSRGFGAWVSDENAKAEKLPDPLDKFEALKKPLDLRIPFKETLAAKQEHIFNSIGNSVKSMRGNWHWSGNTRTQFGTIQGGRQKSVYIFRPVAYKSGFSLRLFHFPDFYAEKRDFAPKANGTDFREKNFRKR